MLSNAYFLAKFHFDTAENEPAKRLQNFAKHLLTLTPKILRTESCAAGWSRTMTGVLVAVVVGAVACGAYFLEVICSCLSFVEPPNS